MSLEQKNETTIHDEKSINQNISLEQKPENRFTNLLDLSADLNFLLGSNLMTDITLHVNGKYLIYCHKDILKFRSKWFFNAIHQAESRGVDEIEIIEDIHILEIVLRYVYTGNLRLLESSDVSVFDIYEAAEKYGFSRLENLIRRIFREKELKEVTKSTKFQWTVKMDDCESLSNECPFLDGFSLCETDNWKMKIMPLHNSDEDGYDIGIYLSREMEEPHTTIHIVSFTISVIDSSEMVRFSFFDKLTFAEDDECLLKSLSLSGLKETRSLLADGTLSLSCEITIVAGVRYLIPFKLEDSHERYVSNELVNLSKNMYDVFKLGNTHDVNFCWSSVKMHSYILIIRSRIPKDYINMLSEKVGFGRLGWTSFATFLYTGQARYLDDHGRAVYSALCGTVLTMAKEKYAGFLAKNLTCENAFGIMCDAVSGKDNSLISAAANFLAGKSTVFRDPQYWIQIANNKNSFFLKYPEFYAFKQI